MSKRTHTPLNTDWTFTGQDGNPVAVNLPHTWNALDGQDGGNNYYRGTGVYEKRFSAAPCSPHRRVYLQFDGVNASAEVRLNGQLICRHNGGYSLFRADITHALSAENLLVVTADNAANEEVYPQKADFTFYGGIYRAVELLEVDQDHFDLDYYGSGGMKVTATVENTAESISGRVEVETFTAAQGAETKIMITDRDGELVGEGSGSKLTLTIPKVHLWNGVADPYLYTATAQLLRDGIVLDEVSTPFGVRSFRMDPQEGFFLNGKSYPLRGMSRHQDRKNLGNALTPAEHREDMELLREIGANTVRLAHYQHDQYFYDLCDQYGLVVWAEIPYISEHIPGGRENSLSQMRELIVQNYNHPSIVTWGLSNEITISTKDKADMLENHRLLNDLCHRLDPARPSTLACYAMCSPMNPTAHLADLVGFNLYLGWYVPGLRLNDAFMWLFHKLYPKRCLSYSEYGAEGMPNLHSARPRRGDHSEEYQAIYHEYMLRCFARHPFLWGTYCWNLFDFAADARDQGGEPGMNHKGLVTFDRKTKKDSFYLYKAYWNPEPMVHLCGRRYVDRAGENTTVKVYSNRSEVALYNNGKLVERKTGDKVFTFQVPLAPENRLEAVTGDLRDEILIRKVSKANPDYILKKTKSANWV